MSQVLGMGNALVDIMTMLKNDNLLKEFSLPKGTMQLVPKEFTIKIFAATRDLVKKQSAGGSAANMINGLANLGVETAFIGKVGKDDLGQFFKTDLEANKIVPKLFSGGSDTGRAFALVSPDSERTFATFLGAALELSENDITESLFDGYKYFHIEGYLVQNHKLLTRALEMAKAKKLIISLDLASHNVVTKNVEFLKSVVKQYVDIVFANEEEAKAYIGKEPEEALDFISKQCDIAVVKLGPKGSLIKKGKSVYKIDPVHVNPIDTTGAGDLYAAGFIYGLTKDFPLDKCGKIGSLISARVIEVIGAKMDAQMWADIRDRIARL